MKMTKAEAFAHIQALYHCFNAADSDSEDRADWTKPEMAGTCCRPLDSILNQLFTVDQIEAMMSNGDLG